MTSVVSLGTTDRITSRRCFNVLCAGSGTAARYSSTVFATLPFRMAALKVCHPEQSGSFAKRDFHAVEGSLPVMHRPLRLREFSCECASRLPLSLRLEESGV